LRFLVLGLDWRETRMMSAEGALVSVKPNWTFDFLERGRRGIREKEKKR
jgi:hypothetical protein